MFYGAKLAPADKGVEIVDAGNGRLAKAGGWTDSSSSTSTTRRSANLRM